MQRFERADPASVMDAYTRPELYATFTGLTKVATPEVVSRQESDGYVHVVIRMRFIAEVNAAVRRVVDPARITWLQDERYDLAAGTAVVRFQPDNYADRFTSEGGYTFAADERGGTARTISGDLRVRVPLVGGQAERALVSGLREHFEEEQPLVQRYLDERAPG
jgi:hypothetical protein